MGFAGSTGWRWIRRLVQLVPFAAIAIAPLLGGWQRLDRANMAAWDSSGFDLRDGVREQLPLGERPAQAYRALYLVGGGAGAEYVRIPAVDPVAGVAAALGGGLTALFAVALALPLLIAAIVGRGFCGWMCPFGTLSRTVSYALRRLPRSPPVFAVPRRRPLRWLVLVGAIAASVAGAQVVLFVFLPHLLVQQSGYALWLLGGGGAALGVLVGLVLAGLVFGPTLYCATICPTGAALSLPGRARLVRVTLAEPARCGKNCALCDAACWLQLRPSTGEPGPDCDTCARCFSVCPASNLRVTVRRPRRKHLPVVTAGLFAALAAFGAPSVHAAKPELVLNGELERDGVTLAISIVDMTGVKLDADWETAQRGAELSIYIARGAPTKADPRGSVPFRDVYTGPLRVDVATRDGRRHLVFDGPTHPISTPNRVIYRRMLDVALVAGDRVAIAPIDGWTATATAWTIPPRGVTRSWLRTASIAIASAFAFGGLMLLALAGRPPDTARRPRGMARGLK